MEFLSSKQRTVLTEILSVTALESLFCSYIENIFFYFFIFYFHVRFISTELICDYWRVLFEKVYKISVFSFTNLCW